MRHQASAISLAVSASPASLLFSPGSLDHWKARSKFVSRLSISTFWLPPPLLLLSGEERKKLVTMLLGPLQDRSLGP